jgi:hypothetical protein
MIHYVTGIDEIILWMRSWSSALWADGPSAVLQASDLRYEEIGLRSDEVSHREEMHLQTSANAPVCTIK